MQIGVLSRGSTWYSHCHIKVGDGMRRLASCTQASILPTATG